MTNEDTDDVTADCPECGKSFSGADTEAARNSVAGHAARVHGTGYQRVMAQFEAQDMAGTSTDDHPGTVDQDQQEQEPQETDPEPGVSTDTSREASQNTATDGGPFAQPPADPKDVGGDRGDHPECPSCGEPLTNAREVAERVADGETLSGPCSECESTIHFSRSGGEVKIHE